MCKHYKLHQKTLKANLTPEQRHVVDSGFRARLAELLVEKAKRDSNVGPKVAEVAPDDDESPGGNDSFSGEEEEGGGEEEEEGGSDGGDEEGSDDEDSSDDDGNEDASDGAENKDAPGGAKNKDAPEVGDDLPSTSVYGRIILRIRKALHPVIYQTPKPLQNVESSDEQVSRGRRAKRGATIRELSVSGSDMELEGSSGNEAIVAGPSTEEEKLMKESSDRQLMAVDNVMLPDHVESKPGGNRYFLICLITY